MTWIWAPYRSLTVRCCVWLTHQLVFSFLDEWKTPGTHTRHTQPIMWAFFDQEQTLASTHDLFNKYQIACWMIAAFCWAWGSYGFDGMPLLQHSTSTWDCEPGHINRHHQDLKTACKQYLLFWHFSSILNCLQQNVNSYQHCNIHYRNNTVHCITNFYMAFSDPAEKIHNILSCSIYSHYTT